LTLCSHILIKVLYNSVHVYFDRLRVSKTENFRFSVMVTTVIGSLVGCAVKV